MATGDIPVAVASHDKSPRKRALSIHCHGRAISEHIYHHLLPSGTAIREGWSCGGLCYGGDIWRTSRVAVAGIRCFFNGQLNSLFSLRAATLFLSISALLFTLGILAATLRFFMEIGNAHVKTHFTH